MTSSESKYVSLNQSDTSANLLVNSTLPVKERGSIEQFSQPGFEPEKLVPAPTYVECGIEKLTALCNAVGLNAQLDRVIHVFRALTTSWGDRRIGETTTWRSDVSDDCAPFEFSLALDPQQTELRVLIEAQGSDPTLQSNWQAGLDLNQHLAANFNVSLDRFEQIADLFAPTNPEAKFSMWHAVCFYPDKEPAFKLYLNPQAQSPSRSAAVIEESLVRLGFTHAWPTLAETAAQRGPDKDQFVYFSLDLAAHDRARVKVYLRHQDATPAELESALSAARNYVPGDAIEFCQAMAPGQTSFSKKSAITCFSLIAGDDESPSSGTLYIPVSNYAPDDRVVCDRLDLYFIQHSLPVFTYHSAIRSLAIRPLEAGIGMQSYTSFRREKQHQRVAVYLNPEANLIKSPKIVATSQLTLSLQSIEETTRHYKDNSVESHPFFQRLHREPANLTSLWLLFANFQEGIVSHFTRRLALVVAHIDDEHIRCILAKQLNEELGNGDVSQIHRKIFDRLTLALEPYKPQLITTEMLLPGHKLSQSLEALYSDPNPYIGVGAAILMEVRGEQRDEIVNKELARTTLDNSVLSWFYLHGELEVGHADEIMKLAHHIDDSNGDKAGVMQGLELTSAALWDFCNGMYRACFL
ncbi:tryptophan dimethylallyltransferase family protein [Chamaesiphon sp. OTE_8_metabat_110]|uniref:tryptophan dimethylallyltransferase family protein n=1 Tax=Chamaesiphon sp. OTE_8_metabat_110 TaxID=2964696 RepID=UPI00286B9483|nr:tryptophan dimethylallyltransferase family protein [Chamaesiphon sp. OTE_8_metabat_110]